MNRQIAGTVIRWIATAAALATAWQAVRFIEGDMSAPFLDLLFDGLGGSSAPAQVDVASQVFGWYVKGLHYVVGVGLWLWAAYFVSAFGKFAARIVEVGFAQACAEAQESSAERLRISRIELARDRRRQLRHERVHQAEGVDRSSTVEGASTAVALGILLGIFLS